MKYIKLFFILCLFIYYPAYSGTVDPLTPDEKYVEYGAKFDCVVKISGKYQDGTSFSASAVLIDNHHFLTAAHVVNNCKTCFIFIKDTEYPILTVTINKDFDKEFGMGDIAIGYSKKSFGLDYYPPLYVNDDEIGKICSISGYGLTGTFLTGGHKYDGKKRAGSNTIDKIYKDLLICTASTTTSKDRTSLEFIIASGDSGGGLFIGGKLAGVNSCLMANNRSPKGLYGEDACHTRISKFIGWINDNKTKMD